MHKRSLSARTHLNHWLLDYRAFGLKYPQYVLPTACRTRLACLSTPDAVCNLIEQLRLLSANTLDKPTKLSA
jgi:hypothetical protein